MTSITDATPTISLFYGVSAVLHKRGYDSRIMSLYQVRPPNGGWHLEIMMVPRERTGKHAKIELRLDDVSSDGFVSQPRLENLTMYPIDSNAVRDTLDCDIESRITAPTYRLGSHDLGHLIADALDSAGIADT